MQPSHPGYGLDRSAATGASGPRAPHSAQEWQPRPPPPPETHQRHAPAGRGYSDRHGPADARHGPPLSGDRQQALRPGDQQPNRRLYGQEQGFRPPSEQQQQFHAAEQQQKFRPSEAEQGFHPDEPEQRFFLGEQQQWVFRHGQQQHVFRPGEQQHGFRPNEHKTDYPPSEPQQGFRPPSGGQGFRVPTDEHRPGFGAAGGDQQSLFHTPAGRAQSEVQPGLHDPRAGRVPLAHEHPALHASDLAGVPQPTGGPPRSGGPDGRHMAGAPQDVNGSQRPGRPHEYMNVTPMDGGQARVSQLECVEAGSADLHSSGDEPQELSEADERIQRFYGIIPKEKTLEIKAVRIVKRESQLRQKDKTRRPMDETDLTSVGESDSLECETESPDNIIESDAVLSQFRRALSLPRGYDRRSKTQSDAISRIPNFRHHMLKRLVDRSPSHDRLTAHERLFGSNPSLHEPDAKGTDPDPAGPGSKSTGSDPKTAGSDGKTTSPDPKTASQDPKIAGPDAKGRGVDLPLSPVFKSDAARRIVEELQDPEQYRRARPRPKRRHFTISSSRPVAHEAAPPQKLYGRSADDMDMDRALGSAGSAPDVVKSSLTRTDLRYDADTIDTLLGAPQKIHIPERYVPELEVEPLSAEERLQRSRKAASIRRMLTQSSGFLDTIGTVSTTDHGSSPRGSVVTEKLQRAHILQLNEILARQVTEKSKRVAVEALATMERPRLVKDNDSPPPPLPVTQQRESLLT
ncbi:translation initiation factor IF-2-like [Pollicipes pollicipes]|uniref:translation initiation factor IF-2-like n=1 Tax=Pollicipes pollicipes TaxID=41117 RepID=UPI0018853C9C|nr:translation initiation factor IF-2-like [Pollicipes pollicipes]